MELNQKGFSAVETLLTVVIVGLISAVGWLVYDRQNSKSAIDTSQSQPEAQNIETTKQEEAEPKELAKGTFGDSGEYGTLEVEGYATTAKRDEAFCEENCKQYDYVFFNITRTENTSIFNYLESISGNSFVLDESIGIGCIADSKITYYNHSDVNGSKEYVLSKDDTSAIIASTVNKPVVLEIERLQLSGGGGAPTCYSHFTTIELDK